MVIGSLLLTSNDAIVKWVSTGLPVAQLLFLRGALVLAGAVVLFALFRRLPARPYRIGLQVLRAALVTAGTFLFVTGLTHLPLAENITLAFVAPLFTAALAVPLLGERVGWRRWLAIATGFLGVVVIARPGFQAFDAAMLLPIGAALCGSLRDLLTRRMSAREDTATTLVWTTAGVTLAAGGGALVTGWQPVSLAGLLPLAAAAALLGLAHGLHIEAFRHGEASMISPFRYVSLLWAPVLGWLFLQERPDPFLLAGAPLIMGSGLFIWWRERLQPPVPAPGSPQASPRPVPAPPGSP